MSRWNERSDGPNGEESSGGSSFLLRRRRSISFRNGVFPRGILHFHFFKSARVIPNETGERKLLSRNRRFFGFEGRKCFRLPSGRHHEQKLSLCPEKEQYDFRWSRTRIAAGISGEGYQKNMSPVRNSVQIGSNPAIMAIDSGGVYLMVVADQGSGTTSRASIPDSGTPYTCPLLGISFSKDPCQSHTAWSWHVSIAIEPAGNYLFDATLYGKVSRYSGSSSGMPNLLHGSSLAQRDSISRCLFFSDECCGILDPEILFPIEEFRSAMTTLSQESP